MGEFGRDKVEEAFAWDYAVANRPAEFNRGAK
jgi:hypothetical protein